MEQDTHTDDLLIQDTDESTNISQPSRSGSADSPTNVEGSDEDDGKEENEINQERMNKDEVIEIDTEKEGLDNADNSILVGDSENDEEEVVLVSLSNSPSTVAGNSDKEEETGTDKKQSEAGPSKNDSGNLDVAEEAEDELIIDESVDDDSNENSVISVDDEPKLEMESSASCPQAQTVVDLTTSKTPVPKVATPEKKADTETPSQRVKPPVKRRSRIADNSFDPALLAAWKVPFKHGWKREVVNRNVVTGKATQCDIYYFSPQGKKLRSMVEIENWLSDHKGHPVKISNFSFARTSIHEPPFEVVRDAGKRKNLNTSQSDGTPKKMPTLVKRVERKVTVSSKTSESGFKTVLSVSRPKPVKIVPRVVSSLSSSNSGSTSSGPKVKFVPTVKNAEILKMLKKKTTNKMPMIAKRPRPTSPDWLPSSDSDVEKRPTTVREVQVIKQNVIGTPSKLISSIVNPTSTPIVNPMSIVNPNLNLSQTPVSEAVPGAMKFQVYARKNANPDEVIAQLGFPGKTKIVLKPNSSQSKVMYVSSENRMVNPVNIRPAMPNLQPKPQFRAIPVTQQIILPPPPPLASRPTSGRSGGVIGSFASSSLLPPLHRSGRFVNPAVPMLPFSMPSLHSSLIRSNVPPPTQTQTPVVINSQISPLLTTAEVSPSSLPSLSLLLSSTSSTLASSVSSLTTSSTARSNTAASTAPQSNRSSTPDLVDKIFNDLPNFLGLGSSKAGNFPMCYQPIRPSTAPVTIHPNATFSMPAQSDPLSQVNVKDSINSDLNKSGNNVFDNSRCSDVTESRCRKEEDRENDSENEDSMLAISFGRPASAHHLLSATTDKRNTDSPYLDSEDSDTHVNEKDTNRTSSSPLSRKDFLTFKLLQDNYPAMLQIFGHLSKYDLLRASRVCKLWHRITVMNSLWQTVVVKSVYKDNWPSAVKFFIKVGVKSLTILELPKNGAPEAVDVMIDALKGMTQLKILQFNVVPQEIVTRILETMPHLQNVGAEFIKDSEPLINSNFTWSTVSKEFAMSKAVDAVITFGRSVAEAAILCSVPEAELKHLMRTDPFPLLKQEEDSILLCCMRLSRMGFPIGLSFLESRMEEEIYKRPAPCQPSSHFRKLACVRLLEKNQHLFENKMPYESNIPMSKKIVSYCLALKKFYNDNEARDPSSILVFAMKEFTILNLAGNRMCKASALSVLSAANETLPVMLIFPNVVHYPANGQNLILVSSKDGKPTANLVTHYLRSIFSLIVQRPMVIFFNGHESFVSHHLISLCLDNKVFLHCLPQDISNFLFPGNHGGIIESVSRILNGNLVKQREFLDIVCSQLRSPRHDMSQIFARTGLYPLRPSAAIRFYNSSSHGSVLETEYSKKNGSELEHSNSDGLVNEDICDIEDSLEIEDDNNSQMLTESGVWTKDNQLVISCIEKDAMSENTNSSECNTLRDVPELQRVHSAESVNVNCAESVKVIPTESVNLSSAESVSVNSAESVKANLIESVKANPAESVKANLIESVKANPTESVNLSSAESVSVNSAESVKADPIESVKVNSIEAVTVNSAGSLNFVEKSGAHGRMVVPIPPTLENENPVRDGLKRRNKGRVNYRSLSTSGRESLEGKGKLNGNNEQVKAASKVNGPKRGEKRQFSAIRDADMKLVARIPSKKQKLSEVKIISSILSIEETINEVIAKSRIAYDLGEKSQGSDGVSESRGSYSRDSQGVRRDRPPLKIKLKPPMGLSVLSSKNNPEPEKEEDSTDSEDEEEVDSSDKEMEIDFDNEENASDNDIKDEEQSLKTSLDNDKPEPNEASSDVSDQEDRSDEEHNDESMSTSHLLEEESENKTPQKRTKKLKKKKKKKHSHHHSADKSKEYSESEDKTPTRKHKKKKKKKKSQKKSEEDKEKIGGIHTSTPRKQSTGEIIEQEEDETEKKLQYLRQMSLADHDYQAKFDSDSGTEMVKDDPTEMIAASENKNEDGAIDKKEVAITDGDDGNQSILEQEGSRGICEKDATSDSDSSSSGSDDENGSNNSSGSSSDSSGSSSQTSGSNSRSSENSSSSGADSGSEVEEKSNEIVVTKSIVGEENEGNDSEQSSSSWGASANSDSDNEDSALQINDNAQEEEEGEEEEEEEEEEENDGDDNEEEDNGAEDSNCQLCMLSNPPHTKETIIDWVDCDGNCGRWFHVICINRSQSKINPNHYVCPSCRCKR